MALAAYGPMGIEFYPVSFKSNIYIIEKKGSLINEDLFKAVMNGYKIDVSKSMSENGEDNIVDI